MSFDKVFCSVDIEGKNITTREAARMVVEKDGKYLMISTKRGDLIFPGGGAEGEETQKDAAIRELREETGYECIGVPEYLGKVVTRREDRFEEGRIFESVMNYFISDVHEVQGEQLLSENEVKSQIEPVWVSRKDILGRNKSYEQSIGNTDVWVEMIEFILEYVKDKE
jgi:8-oxo-dGTP pyrophosphatase MutT (NUDIX family)